MIPSCVYGFAASSQDSRSHGLAKAAGTTDFGVTLGNSTANEQALRDVRSMQSCSIGQTAFARGLSSTGNIGKETSFYPAAVYSVAEKPKEPLGDTLRRAGKRALGGGVPGAAAMAIQVCTLMPLRSTVNYQYRYGTTTTEALKTLYRDGGVPRFYRGILPALFQGPLSRFGDTAANAGTLALLDSFEATEKLPIGIKTLGASSCAAGFRILLMPIDACKTIMQVEGKGGFGKLTNKVRAGGPTVLFHGALAAATANFVGSAPWFFTYNTLNEKLEQYEELPKRLMRSAFIGFTASAISDTCSNSIRVVKTSKQASVTKTTYPEVVREIIAKEGYVGLFGRGLKTKILANGLQGMMFTVLWRIGQDMWNKSEADTTGAR